jgi:hypothetical protein
MYIYTIKYTLHPRGEGILAITFGEKYENIE